MQRECFSKAFTLVELLCAIALIGVLSTGLVLLVSRTLEGQLRVQEKFLAEQEAARGFAWIARDIESAWLPLSGEPWLSSEPSEGGVLQSLIFSRWDASGIEPLVYRVSDGALWRTLGTDESARISQVCTSVVAFDVKQEGHSAIITLVLQEKNGGQRSFTRVLAPMSDV